MFLDPFLHFFYFFFERVFWTILVNISLIKNFRTVFHSWEKNNHITKGNERLTHRCHKQNHKYCENMERNVYELWSLLNNSVVSRVFFNLLLLLFHEVFRPNLFIFEVHIICKNVVQIDAVLILVLQSKLIVFVCPVNLSLVKFSFWIIAWFLIIFYFFNAV